MTTTAAIQRERALVSSSSSGSKSSPGFELVGAASGPAGGAGALGKVVESAAMAARLAGEALTR
jgi:hypothetical protein